MTILEKVANIAVIATCCLVCASVVHRFAPGHGAPSAYRVGGHIADTAALALGSAPRSILLVTSTRCHFCQESMPYYRKLVEAARPLGVRVVALSAEPPSESRGFFEAYGIPIENFAGSSDNGVRVPGTPTLIVVRRDGTVLGSWTGKLSAGLEAEVLRVVTRG